MKQRPFVTTREIREMADCHPGTVYLWIRTGKIVPVDVISKGHLFLFDRKEIEDFLAKWKVDWPLERRKRMWKVRKE